MKNLHLKHVEDTIFDGTTLTPLLFIEEAFKFIDGRKSKAAMSVKWDGAPAFVCGPHPETGKFFVGTKGVFTGKLCFDIPDIAIHYPDSKELQLKLANIFHNLKDMGLKQIVQGDLLYWGNSRMIDRVERTISFQPNTLRYQVGLDTDLGKTIMDSEIGVVLHTSYKDFDSDATFGIDRDNGYVRNAFVIDPRIVYNIPVLTTMEKQNFEGAWSMFVTMLAQINYDVLSVFTVPKMNDMVKRYLNYEIRQDTMPNADIFLKFLESNVKHEVSRLKTEKGRKRKYEEWILLTDRLKSHEDLGRIFRLYNHLVLVKSIIVKALDRAKSVDVFLPDGQKTGHEGYVITMHGETLKMVDRYGFARANMLHQKAWAGK